jgi:aryl-alcohol dehydrogenase-like predicted oxidoreductase
MRRTKERRHSRSIKGNGASSIARFERDIIPMARAEGLALFAWDVPGGGKIRSDAEVLRSSADGRPERRAVRQACPIMPLIGSARRKRGRCVSCSRKSQRRSEWSALLPVR